MTYRKGHHRRKHGFKSEGTFCPKLASVNERMTREFGITREQSDKMLEAQNGVCAICSCITNCKSKSGELKWCIDHCHKTGKVRGILCHLCNAALGLFRDDIQTLENARAYLIRSEQ